MCDSGYAILMQLFSYLLKSLYVVGILSLPFFAERKMNVMLMSLPNLYVNTFTPSVILLDVEPLEDH